MAPPRTQPSLSNQAAEHNFETLFARYAAPIYRFCLRLSRNPSDAEDLAQEVFVAAFLGQSRFAGRSSLTTYLYRIAVFRWHLLRNRRSRAASASPTIATSTASSTPDIADSTADRVDLEAALQTLDERHRAAFLLVKVEGMTCREASAVLGIPEGTVKYHIHGAVRHLQAALAKGDVAAPVTKTPRRTNASAKSSAPLQAAAGGNAHEL